MTGSRTDRQAVAAKMSCLSGIMRRADLPTQAKILLEHLLFAFHNASTGRCDPSLATLARSTGQCVRTVRKYLRWLESRGLVITTHRRRSTDSRVWDTNSYRFPLLEQKQQAMAQERQPGTARLPASAGRPACGQGGPVSPLRPAPPLPAPSLPAGLAGLDRLMCRLTGNERWLSWCSRITGLAVSGTTAVLSTDSPLARDWFRREEPALAASLERLGYSFRHLVITSG